MKNLTIILSGVLMLLSIFSTGKGASGKAVAGETKKVLYVIANFNFRDEEFKTPYDILKGKGARITVASNKPAEAHGVLGMKVKPDTVLSSVNGADYDAVVFAGGPGATVLFNDKDARKIAKDAAGAGKVVAAICIAPVILANAGLLKGKKATVFETESTALTSGGAIYTGKEVEKDGLIITADGPGSAKKFGNEMAAVLFQP